MVILWIVGYFCFSFSSVLSSGRTKFECPDGFYLSNIDSVYENGKRLFSYSCKSMLDQQVSKENCEANNVVSTTLSDMYLTCNSSQQYVVGVSIVDYNDYQTWSLSCCESSAVRFDLTKCSLTPFINEYQKSFHFVLEEKHLMRKWQSIYDESKSDRRWWIQMCPYEIDLDSTSSQSNVDLDQSQTKIQPESNHIGKKFDQPERRYKPLNNMKPKDISIKGSPPLNIIPTTYDDYYDPDGIMKREKLVQQHGEPVTNEIFKNLHKIFKTIQDGLVFFQWALSDDGQPTKVPRQSLEVLRQSSEVAVQSSEVPEKLSETSNKQVQKEFNEEKA